MLTPTQFEKLTALANAIEFNYVSFPETFCNHDNPPKVIFHFDDGSWRNCFWDDDKLVWEMDF